VSCSSDSKAGRPARALALLTPRLGARRAQERLQQVLGEGRAASLTAEQALVRSALFSPSETRELTAEPDPGCCPQMTDLIVARATAAPAAEPPEWPCPRPFRPSLPTCRPPPPARWPGSGRPAGRRRTASRPQSRRRGRRD